ncbi:MAG: hypothetical protein LBH85_10045 [Treponema sp.]|jgi:hypothetical protein|nr:hypothetical protein [Treponema sp.]
MPHSSNFTYAGDADFDSGLENLVDYVVAKTSGGSPAWPHVPQSAVASLASARAAWRAAYQKTFGAHTPVDTEAKNDARKAAAAITRPFIAQYLMFPPVSNEDRTAMRLHNRDTRPTPIGEPKTRPVITDIRALGGFQVKIWFRDETTPDSRAIPYGCNGCLLNFAWSREQIGDVSALTQTKLLTHSPFTLTFPPEAQANFLSCAARWQNEKGELGPWSDIQHVVIG